MSILNRRVRLTNAVFDGATQMIDTTALLAAAPAANNVLDVRTPNGQDIGLIPLDFERAVNDLGLDGGSSSFVLEYIKVFLTAAGNVGDEVQLIDPEDNDVAQIIDLGAGGVTLAFSSVRTIFPAGWKLGVFTTIAAGDSILEYGVSQIYPP